VADAVLSGLGLISLPFLTDRFPAEILVAGLGFALLGRQAALCLALWPVSRPADLATLGRFLLLLAGLVLAVDRGPSWEVAAFFGLILLSDAVDGWLARRHGPTAAGAVLDPETDQAVVLALAALAVTVAGCPAFFLLYPGLRCLYVLALLPSGAAVEDPKPQPGGDNRRGRRIAVLAQGALLGPWLPILPLDLTVGLATAALGLLGYSFAADLRHQLRQPPPCLSPPCLSPPRQLDLRQAQGDGHCRLPARAPAPGPAAPDPATWEGRGSGRSPRAP
jgi:phosphatidylglycerophosphate synthase